MIVPWNQNSFIPPRSCICSRDIIANIGKKSKVGAQKFPKKLQNVLWFEFSSGLNNFLNKLKLLN